VELNPLRIEALAPAFDDRVPNRVAANVRRHETDTNSFAAPGSAGDKAVIVLPSRGNPPAQRSVLRQQCAVVFFLVCEVERLLRSDHAERRANSFGIEPRIELLQSPCKTRAVCFDGTIVAGNQSELGHDQRPTCLGILGLQLDDSTKALRSLLALAGFVEAMTERQIRLGPI
jgi:hypothetical protein